MNNQFPEWMSEYNRQKVLDEINSIRLEEEARKTGKPKRRWLAQNLSGLGDWMISKGEKLRKLADSQKQDGSADFFQSRTQKFGA